MDRSERMGLEGRLVVLSEIDRRLLDRCMNRQPRSWEDFVDRFLGLVLHVIDHTALARSTRLHEQDREDLAAEVFLALIDNDFSVLRRFRGESSLATYLTVVSRRIVVRNLLQHRTSTSTTFNSFRDSEIEATQEVAGSEQRIVDRELVEQLLARLNGTEADVVRMYHLEGKSYREISMSIGIAENSIGPTLSRARSKLKRARADSPI